MGGAYQPAGLTAVLVDKDGAGAHHQPAGSRPGVCG